MKKLIVIISLVFISKSFSQQYEFRDKNKPYPPGIYEHSQEDFEKREFVINGIKYVIILDNLKKTSHIINSTNDKLMKEKLILEIKLLKYQLEEIKKPFKDSIISSFY